MPGQVSARDAKTLSAAPYWLAPRTHSASSASIPLTTMLRHIFTAAAVPISPSTASRRMPSGVIAATKRCAAGPPINIGTRWP
jgi:hypothetical protein